MKNFLTLLLVLVVTTSNAQAFKGKGDTKFQVGASFQNGGTGINSTLDFGIGENMSFGVSATYLLKADAILNIEPKFEDRADINARFNANIGNVLKLDEKFDLYPGLHLGIRNFGAHLGARYFFSDGFGVYTEASIPIAQYNTKSTGFQNYNNQFVFNIGASFNL